MINMLEIRFWHMAKWLIRHGYGQCENLDYEEMQEIPHELNNQARCGSCQATEVVRWIEGHIALLKN